MSRAATHGRAHINWRRAGLAALAGAAAFGAAQVARDRVRRHRLLQQQAIRALDDKYWVINGRRVFAYVARHAEGRAPPVVLVHGFGVSSTYFLPAAERLAARFPVYAPDLPGHGRSETPPRTLDIPGLADALLAWMDAAGLRRAILVGQSMGCQIVADLAVRHPERVARLVLIGPTLAPWLRSTPRLAPRFIIGGAFERPSLMLHLLKDFLRMAWRLVPEYRGMLADPVEEKLARIAMPTMLVRGEYDPLVPSAWLEKAAGIVRAEDVAVIRGWGHAVQYSAPQQLVAAITPFLAGVHAERTGVQTTAA